MPPFFFGTLAALTFGASTKPPTLLRNAGWGTRSFFFGFLPRGETVPRLIEARSM
jgi:hypothetical protein